VEEAGLIQRDTTSFSGSIPEHYDSGLGPMIFVDYAEDIARRAAGMKPARVLETAAGTGIVSRRLRDHLPATTQLVSTDLSPAMLEIAKAKFKPSETISFQPADAMALPFPDAAFDVVVCQFGVMFFPDKDKSYSEVHRVLAPGGRYLFSVWDAHRYNAFGRIPHQLLMRLFPDDPPQFQSIPFSYGFEPIRDSLVTAGFADITAHVVRLEKATGDASGLARGLVFGSPVADQIKARGGVTPEQFFDALLTEFQREFGNPGRMSMQATVFSATRQG
jgi:ubiquinone/menaquinone biosynthesis C-methylase UbiE